MKKLFMLLFAVYVLLSCNKNDDKPLRYFEVVTNTSAADWRDTAFIIATGNPALLRQVEAQLLLPAEQRKLVSGALVAGSGGYNRNGSHEFKWHFREDDWELTDFTAEIFDGRPYTDLDLNTSYWLDTMKRFGPWSSYISRELER